MVRYFATAAKGTEQVLGRELERLGFEGVAVSRGQGAWFSGRSWLDAARACLWSAVAVRVMEPVARFSVRSQSELYDGVFDVPWEQWLSPSMTLAVRAVGTLPGLENTIFVAQKTKDAIVDRLRDKFGTRPSVDREDPDFRVFVWLSEGVANIQIELSGEPLFLRGYRPHAGAAPLKETLAAAIIRVLNWDCESPLFDPMCGSGTLLIEADLLARNIAPGILRKQFGFERWASHDEKAKQEMARLRQEARDSPRKGAPISGADISPRMVETALQNAAAAGCEIAIVEADATRLRALPAGVTVTNPPYGERMNAGPVLDWLDEMIEGFSQQTDCKTLGVLVPSDLRFCAGPTRYQPLHNGDIDCELRVYEAGGAPSKMRTPPRRKFDDRR